MFSRLFRWIKSWKLREAKKEEKREETYILESVFPSRRKQEEILRYIRSGEKRNS